MQTFDYMSLLLKFKSIPRNKRFRTFMEISGYPHFENVCSNVLKFYLDPKNEHGLNDLVLNSLLKLIDENFKFDSEFDKAEIYREFTTLNKNRLDLVIKTNDYVIGIENKIYHQLYNDLRDYQNTIKSLCTRKQKPIGLVLSLTKLSLPQDVKTMKENEFVNITYEQIFQNIKQDIGKYINNTNISYVNYLIDFIKSIENLISKAMEEKELWTFFKANSETIQELADSFNEYKQSLYLKIHELEKSLIVNEFAPTVDRQWIYDNRCLVHDYTIHAKYKLAIDTYINPNGWEILIFGRNSESNNFILNELCPSDGFLPNVFSDYKIREINGLDRLVYYRCDDTNKLLEVQEVLATLLARVEKYKKTSAN